MCGIIHLARQAHQQQQHRQHIAPSDSSVSLAVKVQAVTDPITIVIPYAVWNELDYRSKKKHKNQKYKARRAARMLINELKEQQQQRSVIIGTRSAAVRSQSCKEMNQAVEWFLKSTMTALETKEAVAAAVAAPTAMKIWNDDRILACALYEKNQLLTSKAVNSTDGENSIGSVVLITSHKVLSGKGLVNQLLVYSPTDFLRYYNTPRMVGLQSRIESDLDKKVYKLTIVVEEN